jgi:hypothetical protein
MASAVDLSKKRGADNSKECHQKTVPVVTMNSCGLFRDNRVYNLEGKGNGSDHGKNQSHQNLHMPIYIANDIKAIIMRIVWLCILPDELQPRIQSRIQKYYIV